MAPICYSTCHFSNRSVQQAKSIDLQDSLGHWAHQHDAESVAELSERADNKVSRYPTSNHNISQTFRVLTHNMQSHAQLGNLA